MLAAKQNISFTPVRFLKLVGIGAGLGILFAIVILVLLALFMTIRDIPHVMVEPLAVSAAALGGLLGGLVASKLIGEKGMIAGLCTGSVMLFPIMLFSLFIGSFGTGYSAVLKLVTILLAASVGGIMGVNIKKKRK